MTFLLHRMLWAAPLVLAVAVSASAQLNGRLYLDKTTYLAGEPIYLNFELTNNGRDPVQFESGNSYSFCGGYVIDVSPVPAIPNESCIGGVGGSCVSGTWVVGPGATREDKVLLNYDHDLSKPGLYKVRAARVLSYGPPTESFLNLATAPQIKVEAEFQIEVVQGGDDAALVTIFQPLVADLGSKDENRQREAARAIGSVAPAFLEDTIISMLNSPVTRPFALLGLRRLNTPRSRAALANVVRDSPRDSYSYQAFQALQYLSEMGDKTYFPLVLDQAKEQQPNQAQAYVVAAAELGGDDAMPFLVSLLGSSDPFSRANAVEGLRQTGSRDAVPLLIQELLDSDTDLARIASSGLVQLTHRVPLQNDRLWAESPRDLYPQWRRWWAAHGADAPVYGASQCGRTEPLR